MFSEYEDKAHDIAIRLCYHFQISGALAFKEESISVAKMSLWRRCQAFDPAKQELQIRNETKHREELFEALVLGGEYGEEQDYDPYSNFWICSVQYIRGAVLDFFRSQRLITKRVKGQETKHTMLYSERFVPLDRPLADASYGNRKEGKYGDTFGDMIPSRTNDIESWDRDHDTHVQLSGFMRHAHLSPEDLDVLRLLYSKSGFSRSEVAKKLHRTQSEISKIEESALGKIRKVMVWGAILDLAIGAKPCHCF